MVATRETFYQSDSAALKEVVPFRATGNVALLANAYAREKMFVACGHKQQDEEIASRSPLPMREQSFSKSGSIRVAHVSEPMRNLLPHKFNIETVSKQAYSQE